jgi:hypothetical protein
MFRLLTPVLVALLPVLPGCATPVLEPLPDASFAGDPRSGDPCRDHREDDPPLTPMPHQTVVSGTVTEVPSRLGTAAFLIEEDPDRPIGPGAGPFESGEKYHVFVNEETSIHRRVGPGDIRHATLDDVTVGSRAEVWFVGPIRESYPAQGTAGRIMIVDWVP